MTSATAFLPLCAVALLSACQSSPPRGEPAGRAEDPTTTTRSEKGSSLISIQALSEASDQIAQQLATDLNIVPELNQGYRSTIVFGDINNKTGIVPTTDFEAFRANTRAKLMQSRSLLAKIRWIESRARVEQIAAREQVPGADNTLPPLNPQYTYFLNGDMYRVDRNDSRTNYYTLTYNLTNMASGEIIWISSPYEIKQVR
jgi:hypothetical protein